MKYTPFGGMDVQTVVHPHNGILLSSEKEEAVIHTRMYVLC